MAYDIYDRYKKYFIYMRISKPEDDVNGYKGSLDSQEDMCFKLAERLGLSEDQIIPIKEDESSFKAKNRPHFEKMMERIEYDCTKHKDPKNIHKREYGGIIFYKVDRLARNYEEFERIDRIFNSGYELISATETIENTPTGRLLLRMLAGFAIYESEKLSSRQTITSLMNLVKEKFSSLGGSGPGFGYTKKETKNGESTYIVNPKQAEIIRHIYLVFGDIYENTGKLKFTETKNTINEYFGLKGDNALSTKQVTTILKNNGSYRYNGIVKRKVTIQDKTVQDYLNRIKESPELNAEIIGEVIISGFVEFIFYMEEYHMMSPHQYNKIKKLIQTEGKTKKLQPGPYYGVINKLLWHEDHATGRVTQFTNRPEVKIEKKNLVYYKIMIGGKMKPYSQKKIIDKYFSSRLCKAISRGMSIDIDYYYNGYKEAFISENNKKKRHLKCNLMWREREYTELSLFKSTTTKEKHIKMTTYQDEIEFYQDQLKSLDKAISDYLDKIITILTSSNIGNEHHEIQALYFHLIFEKIVIDSNGIVTFHINKIFSEKLDLDKHPNSWKIF